MKKVFLIYPSGELFQRGEERCQSNIKSSSATSMLACNDLGYCASVLRKDYEIFLKDYQSENLTLDDLIKDLKEKTPDVVFISITNTTIFEDIKTVKKIKEIAKDAVIILKGAIFYSPEDKMLERLDLTQVDYLIASEAEFIIKQLLDAHFSNKALLKEIPGILYKDNGKWIRNDFEYHFENLDELPFPARDLMNNSLYVRPDTNEMQATIATSRGCPSSCVFCLTPAITGKKLRLRSPQNIYEELLDCYENYGIRNFFFKSDTFTYDKKWTLELCNLIQNSKLQGKIEWVANSRVNPIDLETLVAMKKAGCWLVAFGFESGSEKSLKLMKKGATLEQNILAGKYAKQAGLQIFGFYLVGFPWEDREDLEKTKELMFKIDADFIELHIATPFFGTKLYNLAKEENVIGDDVLGKDYFNAPTVGTKYLSIKEIEDFRNQTILKYYLRLNYIFKKVFSASTKPKVLLNYFKYGMRLVKNIVFK
ncbi:radical SAM protein [bacterium]|nr:radical SAM protein [bacterium]